MSNLGTREMNAGMNYRHSLNYEDFNHVTRVEDSQRAR